MADLIDHHPLTGEPILDKNGEHISEWWITETKDEDEELEEAP